MKYLDEGAVERLIKHEAQPSALLGIETTPESNYFRKVREYTVV